MVYASGIKASSRCFLSCGFLRHLYDGAHDGLVEDVHHQRGGVSCLGAFTSANTEQVMKGKQIFPMAMYPPTSLIAYIPAYVPNYLPICLLAYRHTCICTYRHANKHRYLHTHTPVHTHIYIHNHMHTFTEVHAYTGVCIHMQTCMLLQVYLHMYISTHTYICIYREQVAVGPGFLQTHFLYHIYIVTTSST